MTLRMAVLAVVVAVSAFLGAYGQFYSGGGVHGFSVGRSDSCMSGVEFSGWRPAVYWCVQD